jgi:predicted Zn-dependent protease
VRVPGSLRCLDVCGLQRRSFTFLRDFLFLNTIFFTICAVAEPVPAESSPGTSAEPTVSFSTLSDISLKLPASLLNRFSKDMVKPMVSGPQKKVDPKYDVGLIGRRNIGSGMDFYSLEREMMMGRQLANDVENSVKLIDDPLVTEYVNRLGQQLVRNSDAKVPFTIKVIDDDQVNAFALPGGFFYVNTGLILAADNEAGLAGVMAHEIAHVAARHATKNQSRSELFNLISIPLIFVGGPAAMVARQAMSLAVPMGMLKFSRNAEREADMLGLQYDYATGYDPQEFVRLFEKMKQEDKEKKSFLAKAFSTHPMTEDRIKRAQEEIAEYLPDRGEYIVDTSEFQQVRARVAEICNRRRVDNGTVNLPVLHRRGQGEEPKTQDGRPTLRRHP